MLEEAIVTCFRYRMLSMTSIHVTSLRDLNRSFLSCPLLLKVNVSTCKTIPSDNMPAMISDLVVWRNSPYNLRGHNKAVVPRFSTYFTEHSVCHRGAVLWNCFSEYFHRLK